MPIGTSRQPQTEWERLVDKIYGPTPTDYTGAYNTAYQNLGQPPQENPNKVIEGTQTLADAYVDRVLQKTGKLPSEDEVRRFVAQNLNSSFATQTIQGINKDQVMSNYVDPYIEQQALLKPDTAAQDEINKGILGLNQQNENLYEAAKAQTGRDVEEAYIPQKQSLVEDLASQNRLGQSNSRYSLNALEAAKNRSLTDSLTNINVSKASSGLDIGKTAQNLLANQRGLGQQAQQFGLSYGLQNKGLNEQLYNADFQRGLDRQKLSLAAQLGRQQAGAEGDSGFGGALGGAAAGAKLGSLAGPWGKAIGTVAGGLGGYFGTRR